MDTPNRYAGLPARTIRRIRFLASKLSRQNALPAMDREDIEQDLVLDLLQRIGRHDPARACLETFAEHVLDNRVATLTRPCARLRTERQMVSIDAPTAASDSDAESGQLPNDNLITGNGDADPASIEKELSLTPALRLCADIMHSGNIAEGASRAGLHRSTIYERLASLRAEATALGLHEYLRPAPTLSTSRR